MVFQISNPKMKHINGVAVSYEIPHKKDEYLFCLTSAMLKLSLWIPFPHDLA